MRDFRFKVWDKSNNKMYLFDEGICLQYSTDLKGFLFGSWNFFEMDVEVFKKMKYEILQYTGLQDKCGRDIYEGDIVEKSWPEYVNDEDYQRSWQPRNVWVDYEFGRFIFVNIGCGAGIRNLIVPGTWEVVGNIYENPELIE